MRLFCADIPACTAAEILGFNRKTIDRYYNIFREKIVAASHRHLCAELNKCNISSSVSGSTVFGVIERDMMIFIVPIYNCDKSTILAVTKAGYIPSPLACQGWQEYSRFIIDSSNWYRVATHNDHPKRIETFWRFTRRRLAKFNGVPSHKFYLYLKECEFRFNNSKELLFSRLLEVL